MQFKDAAHEIPRKANKPLHYSKITDQALAAGLLETTEKTPHASLGALLYTDTLKPNSRFNRGSLNGTFVLHRALPSNIQQQINAIDAQVRNSLRNRLVEATSDSSVSKYSSK